MTSKNAIEVPFQIIRFPFRRLPRAVATSRNIPLVTKQKFRLGTDQLQSFDDEGLLRIGFVRVKKRGKLVLTQADWRTRQR